MASCRIAGRPRRCRPVHRHGASGVSSGSVQSSSFDESLESPRAARGAATRCRRKSEIFGMTRELRSLEPRSSLRCGAYFVGAPPSGARPFSPPGASPGRAIALWTEWARRAWRLRRQGMRRPAKPAARCGTPADVLANGVSEGQRDERSESRRASTRAIASARSEGPANGVSGTSGDERCESPGARERSAPRAFDVSGSRRTLSSEQCRLEVTQSLIPDHV